MRYQTGIRLASRSQVLEKKAQFGGSKFTLSNCSRFGRKPAEDAALPEVSLPPLSWRCSEAQRVVDSGVVVAERGKRLLVSRDLGVHTAKLLRVYVRSQSCAIRKSVSSTIGSKFPRTRAFHALTTIQPA